LLLHAIVHAADIQDRDGGVLLLATLFGLFPFLKKLFADSAYPGPIFHKAAGKILTNSTLKSSNVPIRPRVSSSCQSVGSSNERLLGSIGVAGLPRIGKI
jgi:hypothetical protein